MGLSMWSWFSSLGALLPRILLVALPTNHTCKGVLDYEDAVYDPAMTALKWTAAALVALLAFRATAPITLPDKTSGFNGIAVYDLKY